MRRTLLGTVAASVLGLVSLQGASAADIPPPVYKAPPAPLAWYAEIYGGWTKMRNYNFDLVNGAGTHFPYTIGFDNGWVVGGAIGRQVAPWLRVELDVSHGRNRDSSYTSVPPTFIATGLSGSFRLTTVTANAWLSAPLGGALPFSPYIGGGLGGGWVSGDNFHTNGCACSSVNGTASGFAAIGGAGVRFGAWNNVEIDVGYRYRHVWAGALTSGIAGFTLTSANVATHAVQAGLVFKF